jgi:hypothetical protein
MGAYIRKDQERIIHELKCDYQEFFAVIKGEKLAEIRSNDRCFEEGDYMLLRQTEHSGQAMKAGQPLTYTGRESMLLITHVHKGLGMAEGYVALSFKRLN